MDPAAQFKAFMRAFSPPFVSRQRLNELNVSAEIVRSLNWRKWKWPLRIKIFIRRDFLMHDWSQKKNSRFLRAQKKYNSLEILAIPIWSDLLRANGHEVLSFVENNYGEWGNYKGPPASFDDWVASEKGRAAFDYDTHGATNSDLIIYVGPSGTDAWAEVGAAWAEGIPVYGLWAKGEPSGLMRRMVVWFSTYSEMLKEIDDAKRSR